MGKNRQIHEKYEKKGRICTARYSHKNNRTRVALYAVETVPRDVALRGYEYEIPEGEVWALDKVVVCQESLLMIDGVPLRLPSPTIEEITSEDLRPLMQVARESVKVVALYDVDQEGTQLGGARVVCSTVEARVYGTDEDINFHDDNGTPYNKEEAE